MRTVATAVNGSFVPAPARAATRLGDGDRVEVLAPAGRLTMPVFYGVDLASRLMLGTAGYPSPAILAEAFRASAAGVATVSLRRESGGGRAGADFWDIVRDLGVRVLPNTAGCHSVKEAVTTAQMAREVFGTDWIKLEVIGNADTLQPDLFALVEAARILVDDGFAVFPYTTEDLDRRRAPARCRLRGADAVGRADRLGPRAHQSLRAAHAPRPLPRCAARHRRRPRPAVPGGGGDGDGLRRRPPQHRRRQAGDPVAMADAFALAIEAGGARLRRATRSSRATWPLASTPRSKAFLDEAAHVALDSRAEPASVEDAAPMTLPRFYPIFDTADWLARMLPLGVHLVQLRVKDRPEAETRAEIARSRDLCAAAGATLVVNDHWRLAIDEGCDFVHLGQEDLDTADLAAIRRAGLRLGISTHDEAELDRALAAAPDYVALGPVYPTILKVDALRLRRGSIASPRGSAGSATSRSSPSAALPSSAPRASSRPAPIIVSVVTDITLNPDPEARARAWLEATA